MEPRDCAWCGSAASIEHDVCQVCLMRFPDPVEPDEKVVVSFEPEGLEVEDSGGRAAAVE